MWKTLIYNNSEYDTLEINECGDLRNKKTQKMYKSSVTGSGYLGVCVSLGSRENKKLFKIHKCVASTFIENPENKPYVNHKDGNKLNNNVDNLEWVTESENVKHANKMGLRDYATISGEKHKFSKLTKDDVLYIRHTYKSNDKKRGGRALSRKFNVSKETIRDIIHRNSWKHIGT